MGIYPDCARFGVNIYTMVAMEAPARGDLPVGAEGERPEPDRSWKTVAGQAPRLSSPATGW